MLEWYTKKILCYYVIEIIKQKTEKGYKRENKSNLMHETKCWLLDLGVQKYSVILDLSTKIQQTNALSFYNLKSNSKSILILI